MRDVFLDHPEEVIGHGNDLSLLRYEQLQLLAQFGRDMCLDLGRSFWTAHE